jgi:multicomponent Na+:H+ antiporter subunit B
MSERLHMRMHEKLVLRIVAKRFIPFVLLFGLYVQAHGDYGPGGGFQAGVIFAAGFILYAMIFGLDELQRVAPPRVVELAAALGVLLFAGVGVAALLAGENFLNYSAFDPQEPVRGQHLGIIGVELGVGITVAAVMTTIYYGFAGRGSRR